VSLLVGLSLFAVFFFLTLYMQEVLGFTPLQAGFAYLPFTVGIMLASGRSGAGQSHGCEMAARRRCCWSWRRDSS